MPSIARSRIPLVEVNRATDQGLDVSRLLFAKYLLLTGRIDEGVSPEYEPTTLPPAA